MRAANSSCLHKKNVTHEGISHHSSKSFHFHELKSGSSLLRHFTLTVPPSNRLYKCVPANFMQGITLRWTSILSREGVEILLVTSCYRNWDKLRPDGPLGLYADLTFFFWHFPMTNSLLNLKSWLLFNTFKMAQENSCIYTLKLLIYL